MIVKFHVSQSVQLPMAHDTKKLSHFASNLIFACCKPSSLTTSTLFSAKREVDAVTIRSARLWAELDATFGVTRDEENV